jgi:predicted lactoylglutathione lyase
MRVKYESLVLFVAKDHSEVDAFYKAALAAGGKSKESP